MIPNCDLPFEMGEQSMSVQPDVAENIFDTGHFSDLTLVLKTENNEIRELKVHHSIVAKISSAWFECIENQESSGGRIIIDEFSYETIKDLLQYSYTGYLNFESLHQHIEALQAADFYCMGKIIELCTQSLSSAIIKSTLSIDDFLLIFEYAIKYQNVIIINYCFAYLEENPNFLFDYKEYSNISLSLILVILKSNHYLCTELNLLFFVFNWIRYHLSQSTEAFDDLIVNSKIIQHLYLNQFTLEELRQLYLEFGKDMPGAFWLNLNLFKKVDIPTSLHMRPEIIIRGGENEHKVNEIIVRRPPMTVKEKFFVSKEFPLDFIMISQRINSMGTQLSVDHVEQTTVSIEGIPSSKMAFNAVIPNSDNLVIKPNNFIPVPTPESGFITFLITFFRPGVYKKNKNFSHTNQRFFRPEKGIISHIHLYENIVNDLMEE